MAIPAEYLNARRPVAPELDAARYLQAAKEAYTPAQTSYFGLDPDNVTKSAAAQQQVDNALLQSLKEYQSQAMAQDSQLFNDAAKAQQMHIAAQTLAMQQAKHALDMQKARASMSLLPLQRQLQELQLAKAQRENTLAEDLTGISVPVPMPDGSTMHMSGAQAKELGLLGKQDPFMQAMINRARLEKLQADAQFAKSKAEAGYQPKPASAAQQKLNAYDQVFTDEHDRNLAKMLGASGQLAKMNSALVQDEKNWKADITNFGKEYDPAEARRRLAEIYFGAPLSNARNRDEWERFIGLQGAIAPTQVSPIAAPSVQNLNQGAAGLPNYGDTGGGSPGQQIVISPDIVKAIREELRGGAIKR